MSDGKTGFGNKFDGSSVKQVLDFLFGKPTAKKNGERDPNDSKFMDMRTDVSNKQTFQTLFYYRLLEEQYESKAAGCVADIMERIAISTTRMGRLEAVGILKQQLPKEEVLLKGLAESLRTPGGQE